MMSTTGGISESLQAQACASRKYHHWLLCLSPLLIVRPSVSAMVSAAPLNQDCQIFARHGVEPGAGSTAQLVLLCQLVNYDHIVQHVEPVADHVFHAACDTRQAVECVIQPLLQLK